MIGDQTRTVIARSASDDALQTVSSDAFWIASRAALLADPLARKDELAPAVSGVFSRAEQFPLVTKPIMVPDRSGDETSWIVNQNQRLK
jgi:hypothetical protein